MNHRYIFTMSIRMICYNKKQDLSPAFLIYSVSDNFIDDQCGDSKNLTIIL